MRGFWVISTVLLIALAGCSAPPGSRTTTAAASAPTEAAAPMAAGGARARAAQTPNGAPVPVGQNTAPPVGLPMLAFAYTYTLEAPNDRVSALLLRHQQACELAGPTLCQVTGANVSTDRTNEAVRGTLQIRAQPAWLTTFRATLDRDAQGAGGRVVANATTTEDLTRSIVDTEAYLRAKTTLRDRLQQLLATRTGPLADLIEVERQLAEVQGEIDAGQSQLQVMRTRVATSELTLNYQSASVAITGGTWEPVRNAVDGFLGIIAYGLAAIIILVAVAIPFALVILPIVWLVLRNRRRNASRPAATTPPDSSRSAP